MMVSRIDLPQPSGGYRKFDPIQYLIALIVIVSLFVLLNSLLDSFLLALLVTGVLTVGGMAAIDQFILSRKEKRREEENDSLF